MKTQVIWIPKTTRPAGVEDSLVRGLVKRVKLETSWPAFGYNTVVFDDLDILRRSGQLFCRIPLN